MSKLQSETARIKRLFETADNETQPESAAKVCLNALIRSSTGEKQANQYQGRRLLGEPLQPKCSYTLFCIGSEYLNNMHGYIRGVVGKIQGWRTDFSYSFLHAA